MAKAEMSPEEATAEYATCAQRFARTPVGHYRERREAMAKLARAESAMVKVFGRHDAEARMMQLGIAAIRDVEKAR